jgi:hypothetical protein
MGLSGYGGQIANRNLEELFASQLAEEIEREKMAADEQERAALQDERLAQRAFREKDFEFRNDEQAWRQSTDARDYGRLVKADDRTEAERLRVEAARKANAAALNDPAALAAAATESGEAPPTFVTDALKPKKKEYIEVIVPDEHGNPMTRQVEEGSPEALAGVRTYRAPREPKDEGLSPNNIFSASQRLSTKWENISKNARETQRSVRLMEEGMKAARAGNRGAGYQDVIITFQKILDPNSVVREAEYDRTAAGQSLVNRVEGYIEQLQHGGARMPLAELEKYAELARGIAAQTNEMVIPERERIGRNADYFGVPRQLIFSEGGPGETVKFDAQGNPVK